MISREIPQVRLSVYQIVSCATPSRFLRPSQRPFLLLSLPPFLLSTTPAGVLPIAFDSHPHSPTRSHRILYPKRTLTLDGEDDRDMAFHPHTTSVKTSRQNSGETFVDRSSVQPPIAMGTLHKNSDMSTKMGIEEGEVPPCSVDPSTSPKSGTARLPRV